MDKCKEILKNLMESLGDGVIEEDGVCWCVCCQIPDDSTEEHKEYNKNIDRCIDKIGKSNNYQSFIDCANLIEIPSLPHKENCPFLEAKKFLEL